MLVPDPTAVPLGGDPADEDPDDFTFSFDSDEDADGFTFDFDSDDVAAGALLPDPPSEPARTTDWNSDQDSVLAHLRTLVPQGTDLDFEWKTVLVDDDQYVTGPFPVGWEISEPFLGVDLEAPDGFEFFTDGELSSGCQGSCEPKDWAALMNDPESSPFARTDEARLMVRQQVQGPTGRLEVIDVVDSAFSAVDITLTRWDNAASEFLWCQMSLDGSDGELWPVFADMCLAMRADWLSS